MDIKISDSGRPKYQLFKEFEYIDLIPYSIAIIMIAGYIYLVYEFMQISQLDI